MSRARITPPRMGILASLAALALLPLSLQAQQPGEKAGRAEKNPADQRPPERHYPRPVRLYDDLPPRSESRVKIAGQAKPRADYRNRLDAASERMNFYYRPRLPHPYRFYGGYYGYEYQAGVSDGRHFERLEIQAERGSREYAIAMEAGYQAFAERRYADASLSFIHAATVHQGDPGARLNAAHAQMAIGQYDSAARLIRRALELQPRIPYLPLSIRDSYAAPDDFRAHFSRLIPTTEQNADNPELWFLVGYYAYFSGDRAAAADAWAKTLALRPRDEQVKSLENLSRMTAPGHEKPGAAPIQPMRPVPARSASGLKKI